MRVVGVIAAMVALGGLACIHKRAAHLVPDPPGSGTGSGSDLGSGDIVDGELVHHWTIKRHVLTERATLGDHDAAALDGRLLEITSLGYTSPWQGTCETAARVRQGAVLAKVAEANGLGARGMDAIEAFGFPDELIEVSLTCSDGLKAPPLVVWLSGEPNHKLFTCYGGVCYLMDHSGSGSGSGSGGGSGSGSGSGSGRGSGSGSAVKT
jgi:uncharacterized membrane protein YgcG